MKNKETWKLPKETAMLNSFQHDIWSHLLFILSFWGSQFNPSV